MSKKIPVIVTGFIEGLFAPVSELILSVFITTGYLFLDIMRSGIGASNIFNIMSLTFGLIILIDFIRNIIIALMANQFAIGNIIGNFFGLFIFYGAISAASPESAYTSVFGTTIMSLSLIIGIIIKWWRANRAEDTFDQRYDW